MILEWLYQRLWVDSLGIVYGLLLLMGVCGWLLKRLRNRPKTRPTLRLQPTPKSPQFQPKILCNRPEQSAFHALKSLLRERKQGEMLWAQVSMGEVLRHDDYRQFLTINQKRLDLLVVSAKFEPILAVEIDGSGHFLSEKSKQNDEVKNKALQEAGISLLRIHAPDDNLTQIEREVRAGAVQFFKRYDKSKK